jgi:hypothetical protein
MTTPNSSSSNTPTWQFDLTDLLAEIEAATTPAAEARVLTRLTGMDADFQHFLVARMAEQTNAESATFLAALAAHPGTLADVRAAARAALDRLADQGIHSAATGQEEFYTGWVQQGRERGEQIMILGWRLPDTRIDACVFLLDWRGDGLKDFYRTRDLTLEEWRELVEHNGKKGAALAEISLAEGCALLDEALAEGKRFSRPVPREYKLAHDLIQNRIFDATPPADRARPFLAPDLTAEAAVRAYVAALHYRDYLLLYELLAIDHPASVAGSRAEAIEALRREHKHSPRRREDVRTTLLPTPTSSGDVAEATVDAEGEEELVEPSGRRTSHPVRERYALTRTSAGWRIARIERL